MLVTLVAFEIIEILAMHIWTIHVGGVERLFSVVVLDHHHVPALLAPVHLGDAVVDVAVVVAEAGVAAEGRQSSLCFYF